MSLRSIYGIFICSGIKRRSPKKIKSKLNDLILSDNNTPIFFTYRSVGINVSIEKFPAENNSICFIISGPTTLTLFFSFNLL